MQPLSSDRRVTDHRTSRRLPRAAAGRVAHVLRRLAACCRASVREPALRALRLLPPGRRRRGSRGRSRAALAQLRERLERAYEGRPLPSRRTARSRTWSLASPFRARSPRRCSRASRWDAAGPSLRRSRRAVRLRGAGRGDGRRHDGVADGSPDAGGGGPRVRPGGGHAAHEHRARRRRGRARRSTVPAAASGWRRRASTPSVSSRVPCSTTPSDR